MTRALKKHIYSFKLPRQKERNLKLTLPPNPLPQFSRKGLLLAILLEIINMHIATSPLVPPFYQILHKREGTLTRDLQAPSPAIIQRLHEALIALTQLPIRAGRVYIALPVGSYFVWQRGEVLGVRVGCKGGGVGVGEGVGHSCLLSSTDRVLFLFWKQS
jgi:hypothetical protein